MKFAERYINDGPKFKKICKKASKFLREMGFRDHDNLLINLILQSKYIIDMTIVYDLGSWDNKANAMKRMNHLNDM